MGDDKQQTGERIPTVVADHVDIVYRVHGTGAGRGSATAALDRILRRKQSEKAAGVRKVHAVKEVSFVAYKGEAIGLVGTNGSGKSTLLKAIAGVQPVESGRIYTGGQPSLLFDQRIRTQRKTQTGGQLRNEEMQVVLAALGILSRSILIHGN